MVAILWGPSLDTILVVFPVLENVGARAFLEIAEDMIVLIPPNRCLDLEQVLKSKREVGRMGSMMVVNGTGHTETQLSTGLTGVTTSLTTGAIRTVWL